MKTYFLTSFEEIKTLNLNKTNTNTLPSIKNEHLGKNIKKKPKKVGLEYLKRVCSGQLFSNKNYMTLVYLRIKCLVVQLPVWGRLKIHVRID